MSSALCLSVQSFCCSNPYALYPCLIPPPSTCACVCIYWFIGSCHSPILWANKKRDTAAKSYPMSHVFVCAVYPDVCSDVGFLAQKRVHESCTSVELKHTSAYVRIRQHTSAYVRIRQRTSAYVSIRQHTSAYVSIRQHTPA